MKKLRNSFDSMDLLLDAMCNVFGAVLFLAILLGGIKIASDMQNDSGTVSRAEYDKLAARQALLKDQLHAAEKEYTLLAALSIPQDVQQLKIDPKLLENYQKQTAKVNALADRIEHTQKQLAAAQKRLKIKQYLSKNPGKAQAELDSEIARLQKLLAEIPAEKIAEQIITRSNTKQPFRILLTCRKVYLIGSNRDIRLGSSNDSDVTIKLYRRDASELFHITKRPEKGIKLENFSLDMLPFSPEEYKDHFVEILVEDDAIAQTAVLLKLLRSRNISYNWRTVSRYGANLHSQTGAVYEVVQ